MPAGQGSTAVSRGGTGDLPKGPCPDAGSVAAKCPPGGTGPLTLARCRSSQRDGGNEGCSLSREREPLIRGEFDLYSSPPQGPATSQEPGCAGAMPSTTSACLEQTSARCRPRVYPPLVGSSARASVPNVPAVPWGPEPPLAAPSPLRAQGTEAGVALAGAKCAQGWQRRRTAALRWTEAPGQRAAGAGMGPGRCCPQMPVPMARLARARTQGPVLGTAGRRDGAVLQDVGMTRAVKPQEGQPAAGLACVCPAA